MKPELFTPEQRAEIAAMIADTLAPMNRQMADRLAALAVVREAYNTLINLEEEREKMLVGGICPKKVEDWYQRACARRAKYSTNREAAAAVGQHQ